MLLVLVLCVEAQWQQTDHGGSGHSQRFWGWFLVIGSSCAPHPSQRTSCTVMSNGCAGRNLAAAGCANIRESSMKLAQNANS